MTSLPLNRSVLRKREWLSFLFFTLVALPAIAVAFVASYGFVVWMSHEIIGPPTVVFQDATGVATGYKSQLPIVPPADEASK
ncbi:periplasmic nitrate reductase, NapE protein [Ruegeria sp. 2205SS24-7]|uniref:periplasmic nitrate reductase, NapE protein n=1 Tax=Ruegeria discodermiae TaxID=3064389 RepID=UPI00274164F0|nr:periplasmic nitrate reductase, NapE protein [Ruegeria sp. 2205SS24-7]MDP5218900.1 periplasmic nitrate reductase, NapE protein [Ruegeria sp. 2205SS24-7]